MKNLRETVRFNDINAWKLPAAMYFDRDLKTDSIIAYSGFSSGMPCCISGGECKMFNSIDAVAGYIKHHLIYDNIVYNLLKMEYSTTQDECADEACLLELQNIWNWNVGATKLLEYVEQSYPDRWDKKLTELKTYVETVCKTLDKIFECNDEKEKKNILLDAVVLFTDFFGEICRWSFDLSVYFGTAEFIERYEEHYDIPLWLCDKVDIWNEIKSGKLDDEHASLLEAFIRSINA